MDEVEEDIQHMLQEVERLEGLEYLNYADADRLKMYKSILRKIGRELHPRGSETE